MEKPLIAITGSSGFVGINTVINASNRGWNIKPLVRNSAAAEKIQKIGISAEIVKNFSQDTYRSIFRDCDAVIHLIAKNGGRIDSYDKINLGSLEAVTAAAAECGIKRIIFISGLGVHEYGNKFWATNEYFKSKLLCERFLQTQEVPFVIFRPSYIIGAGDSLIRHLYKSIKRKIVLTAGPGDTPMQPIYIHDATDALLYAAAGAGPDNSFYDLVGPEIINRNELINRTAEIMRRMKINVPNFQVAHIELKEAPLKMGYSKIEADISQCDIIGDYRPVLKNLSLKLTPIDVAIEESVQSIVL